MKRSSTTSSQTLKQKLLFSDFEAFEGDPQYREVAKSAFMNDETYELRLDQPRLDFLYDDPSTLGKGVRHYVPRQSIVTHKTELTKALMVFETSYKSGQLSAGDYQLHVDFVEAQLTKIRLVEAARRIRVASSTSDKLLAQAEFEEANRELYGDIDPQLFSGIMHTECMRLKSWQPVTGRARKIAATLEQFFADYRPDGEEQSPMSQSVMDQFNNFIHRRYKSVLAAVPTTNEDVIYNLDQSVAILQAALQESGLYDKGWRVEPQKTKSNPTTDGDDKRIYLPLTTKRTASQLRRLIIHEVEVHARRAENGRALRSVPLQYGTADYAEIEEGLGVLLECGVDGNFDNASFNRARDRYITAGLALGADGLSRNARDTYEILWRLIALRSSGGIVNKPEEQAAKEAAILHIENAYRGAPAYETGVIYRKLKVYWEGLMKNGTYIEQHIDNLDTVFDVIMLGKFNHTDSDETAVVQNIAASSQVV